MNIGFIGLGNIGKPMALNVVGAGHRTVVHDIRPEAATDLLEAGAMWAATPADAARGSDVVMGSLPGPLEVEAVVSGEQGVLDGAAEAPCILTWRRTRRAWCESCTGSAPRRVSNI